MSRFEATSTSVPLAHVSRCRVFPEPEIAERLRLTDTGSVHEVEEDTEETSTENIPLNPMDNGSKGAKQKLKSEKVVCCKCEISADPPCIHILAATGEEDQLAKALKKLTVEHVFNLLDKEKRTALHCAANFRGNPKIAERCVQQILYYVRRSLQNPTEKSMSVNNNNSEQISKKILDFVDAPDKNKYTALYLAAKRGNSDLCFALLGTGADWDVRSWRGKSPAEKIFKKMPQLISRLIKDFTPVQSEYEDGMRTRALLDFGTIITYPNKAERISKQPEIYEELVFLSNMCYTRLEHRMDILKQPLVKALIWLKWRKIKWLVLMARFFQIAWFLLYSIFLIVVYRHDCPYDCETRFNFHYWFSFEASPTRNISETTTASATKTEESYCHSRIGNILVWILLTTLFFDLICFQIPPIRVRLRRYWRPMKTKNFRKYFKRFLLMLRIIHIGKLTFLLVTFVTLVPILRANFEEVTLNWKGWYILASIGIGLTWFNILIQIGKIPHFKVYIKMLTKVLHTLGVVLLIYSAMIIAFAMVFCILIPGQGSYASPIQAILKMSTFFIGEVDYNDTFYGENAKDITVSREATLLVFGVGIVILNIALFNFVVGLTVTDIQDLKQYTEMWENYSVLWQIFLFDTFLTHFPIKWIGHKLLPKVMLFPPSAYESEHPCLKYSIALEILPKSLQKEFQAVLQNVINLQNKSANSQDDIAFLCVKKSYSRDADEHVQINV